jgi:hypothetical protein
MTHMKKVPHSSLALIVLAVVGCATAPRAPEVPQSIVVRQTAGYPAGHPYAEADVIAYFESWDRMFLYKPQVSDGQSALPLTKARFVHMLDALGVGRRFVLVTFRKSVEPPEVPVLDEVESFFRECRFQRVVIEQARGFGPQPVLRDTAETK